VLDTGTPGEVVARRELRATEAQTNAPAALADRLRGQTGIEEVLPFGDLLRVLTRGDEPPERVIGRAIESTTLTPPALRPARVTLEDAFVAMVRDDERRREHDGPSP
jgi:hypothetical protein